MDNPPHPGVARFDSTLSAWVLSSYADVSTALRDTRLSATGVEDAGDASHIAIREAATREFSNERLAAWRARIEQSAREFTGQLPDDRPVDLVREFAEPWSLALAMIATGAPPAAIAHLASLAREVFLAAGNARNSDLTAEALAAIAELARHFPAAGPSVTVQAFLALSQTLPCFLAGAWLELLDHPAAMSRLRYEPELLPQAVDELLRYAGPSRAVFRRAAAPLQVGCASIRPGQGVVLMLAAANRDPAQFPNAERLDFDRGSSGHLAFGGGSHFCAGAAVIRMAATIATAALLDRAYCIERAGEVDWIGGFAIRGPASLPVVLRRSLCQPHSSENKDHA